MAYMRGYPTGKQPFPKVRLVENEYPSNATWKTSIKNLKEYKHNFKVINEWMNEWRVVDERTTDVPYLQYILNMWTVSSDVSIQKAPLTAALSPFMSLLYPPNPWCEWCDVWRLTTTPGSTSPTLFQQWCGFFYVLQEPNKCKCCETGPTVFRPYPRSSNPWLPSQQTGALPTEPTRGQ